MLFGLPLSVWSTIGSAFMGFLSKHWAQSAEEKMAERKHERDTWADMAKANKENTENEIALLKAKTEYHQATDSPHTSMTRRILALGGLAIFAIVPFLVLFGGFSWFEFNTFTESSNGFFGIGGYSREVTDVMTGIGLPLAWLASLDVIIGAVVGFYFGTSAAKRHNPFR